jgi:hypothetical protein
MNTNDFDKNEALQDDPSHYFNEEHFTTLVLNSDSFAQKNKEQIENLVSLLSKGGIEDKDEALRILKKEDGREMLLFAIAGDDFKSFRQQLVAACWESGLDFSKFLEFFVQIILGSEYAVCMEACTVIECMEGPFPSSIKELCLNKLQDLNQNDNEKKDLVEPVIEYLSSIS